RAETLRCRERVFSGESSIPGIRPGYTFTLKDHYNPTFNRDYLVTDVIHEGSQESFINLGLGIPLEGVKDHLFYRNSFHCVEADRPFRPEKRAPRAKIAGVVHAFIDGARTDARPELDAMGRYKILFPFDVSGRNKGKASCWVRMAQQQVGKNSGMSFPLLTGTEVLVSFVDGNPDRPYITGALANAETGALVGDANNNISGISTAGGNRIVFNDSPKKQAVGMTTAAGSGFVMGAGSSDAWFSKSNLAGDMCSIGASQIANVFHSTMTGHTILHETLLPHPVKYGPPICEAVEGVLEAVGDALVKKGGISEGAIIGMDVAKTIFLLFSMIEDANWFRKGRDSIYGYTVRCDDKDGVMSKLQTPVNWKEILIGCLCAMGSTVSELVNEENETDEETEQKETALEEQYKDGLVTPEEYADKKKKLAENKVVALTHTRARTLGDNLAEITATLVLAGMGMHTDKEKMGGILLHADTANIGLHAKNAILLNVEGGMVLHVGDRLKEQLTDGYVDTVRDQPILKWGSMAINKEITKTGQLFNFTTDDVLKNVTTVENIKSDLPFLVDSSGMRYTDAKFLVESVDEIRKSLARKHIIVAKDGATESAIVVQKSGFDKEDDNPQQPSNKGGIYLTSLNEHGVIQLEANNFLMVINDDCVSISNKHQEDRVVRIEEEKIELKVSNSTVTVNDNSIIAKSGAGTIEIKDDVIKMDNTTSQVKINNIGIDGKQNAINNIWSISGGAIRIMS
ncbi:MAG: type VI secretion system tip protein VgrG, partial [Zoogloeaceae bacterium]|nr:type VI secretion system tip protein VgrG [Zoogloeaceae bacterium]